MSKLYLVYNKYYLLSIWFSEDFTYLLMRFAWFRQIREFNAEAGPPF